MVDGISGVDLFSVLVSPTPDDALRAGARLDAAPAAERRSSLLRDGWRAASRRRVTLAQRVATRCATAASARGQLGESVPRRLGDSPLGQRAAADDAAQPADRPAPPLRLVAVATSPT